VFSDCSKLTNKRGVHRINAFAGKPYGQDETFTSFIYLFIKSESTSVGYTDFERGSKVFKYMARIVINMSDTLNLRNI
jgi:hypothetical protein